MLLFSYIAHLVGAPEIMGGFAAGVAMGHKFKIAIPKNSNIPFQKQINRVFAASPEFSHRLEDQVKPLIHLFSPIFFVMVGVSLDLNAVDWGSSYVWELSLVLLAIGLLCKFLAGFAIREHALIQTSIGLCMIPRGEVGLIFAQLGLSQGILDVKLYAAMLIVIALTTLLPPFALKWLYARWGKHPALASNRESCN